MNSNSPVTGKDLDLTQFSVRFLKEKGAVLGRVAEPEDVARVIVFLCSDDARHITGQVILVDGGLTLH